MTESPVTVIIILDVRGDRNGGGDGISKQDVPCLTLSAHLHVPVCS